MYTISVEGMNETSYYRAYESESETDSETGSDTETGSDSGSSITSSVSSKFYPNFASFANLLLNPELTGRPLTDISNQVIFNRTEQFSLYNPSIDAPLRDLSGINIPEPTNKILTVVKQRLTSIINIDSINRDKKVYPQPTNLKLLLPRVYKDISDFQIVQISLLSSFLYFRNAKQNTSISIHEQSRFLDANGNVVANSDILNVITKKIRQGSYDINTLINELTIHLNTTPIFYDFINGFNDFVLLFSSTGDYSKNFNLPGDYYYDSLLNRYIANPTVLDIVTKYFEKQYAEQTSYSIDNMKIAYYYPVLKEMLLDNNYTVATIDFTSLDATLLLPTETPYSRCVFFFQGLNDPYILSVIQYNSSVLEAYRLAHTFRYSLINKYTIYYDTFNNNITINSPSLNTSLVNLLNIQQSNYYSSEFASFGITQDQYNGLYDNNTALLSVLTDMYNFLQTHFARSFGVEYSTYSLDYYGNIRNYTYLQSGSNANVSVSYDTNLIQKNITPLSNNLISYNQSNPPYYWPNLASNLRTNYALNKNHTIFTGNRFNLQTDLYENYPLIESNTFYTNRLLNHVDAVVNIDNTSYTVFKFNASNRQTLSVATLPRPTKYRYPEYNSNYTPVLENLFDNSYNFIFNTSNSLLVDPTISVQEIPGFTNTSSNFGTNLSNSTSLWSNSYASISPANNSNFFKLYTPIPDASNAPAYRYTMNISVTPVSNTFPTSLQLFVYRDVAAFYADISSNGVESSYNYLYSNTILENSSQFNISLNLYSGKDHYILVHSITDTPPNVNYRVVPWFSNTTYTTLSNSTVNFDPTADPQCNLNNLLYARSYDTQYLNLPSYTSLYQANPFNSKVPYDVSYNNVPLGYDASNISTDLTHYIRYVQNSPTQGFVPNQQFGVDPISQYIFRVQGGYNSATQNYFYSNSSNKLFTPQLISPYTPSVPSKRTYSQVHYYGTTYIPNVSNQPTMPVDHISAYVSPYSTKLYTNSLVGYIVDDVGNLQLGEGVYGLSLIPGEGTWSIERYMFKSIFTESSWTVTNIYDYSNDPNLSIKYLGIYYANVLPQKLIGDIQLSDSIVSLEFSKSSTYNSSNLDFGFGSEGGTYYEFINRGARVGKYSYLYGFTENSNTITTDINNAYTVVAFDINSNVIPFIGLTGSLVPYPYYSDAVASNNYSGTSTSNGHSLIVPLTKINPDTSRGPPAGFNETQCQYEQSMPIGTTYQGYAVKTPLEKSDMYAWSNFDYNPSRVYTDINGYVLTQDSEFRVYTFNPNSTARTLVYKNSFTADEVFNYNSNITLVAVAANERVYAFLGLIDDGFTINTYDPVSGSLNTQNIYTIVNFSAVDPQCESFTYNNFGGYTFSYKEETTGLFKVITASKAPTSTSNVLQNITNGSITYFTYSNGTPANLENYITLQHPKENTGKFYVAYSSSSVGITSFYYVDPTLTISPDLVNPGFIAEIQGVTTTYAKIVKVDCSSYIFDQYAITRDPIKDIVYAFSYNTPTKFNRLSYYTSPTTPGTYDSNAVFVESDYTFPTTIKNITAGYAAALWCLDNSGTLYANRGITSERTVQIDYAWQLFYPTQRVVYSQISKTVDTISDLSGLTYPEFAHTQLFLYNSDLSFNTDISGSSEFAPWGSESNFFISDTHYSGYYFNAYSKMPLQASSTPYYLAVRNYSPTEKSQVYMRFSLQSRYDYGLARFIDISNELQILQSNASNFNPNYATDLKSFNSNFVFAKKTFGANILSNFYGITLSNVSGFGDFMRYYTETYNSYQSNITVINTVQTNVNTNLSNFISQDLQYIIPPSATNRQQITAPLLFSIRWASSLLPEYLALDDSWGLGWNLGYAKVDTDYNVIHSATSFYKILDDYINLRLNPEFNFNNVDITGKENLSATRESTGETKSYYGKLLLAPFGSYAQTMIMNPITFNPPLTSLEQLSATWYDNTQNVIDNADCEWSATIQIVENVNIATLGDLELIKPR